VTRLASPKTCCRCSKSSASVAPTWSRVSLKPRTYPVPGRPKILRELVRNSGSPFFGAHGGPYLTQIKRFNADSV
jgi:hypothetical protein